jgi:hypothetical protein
MSYEFSLQENTKSNDLYITLLVHVVIIQSIFFRFSDLLNMCCIEDFLRLCFYSSNLFYAYESYL